MNKKELNEIKKLFGIKNCSVTRVAGCYVDAEKKRKSNLQQEFPFLAGGGDF